jgi:hypothetical protein
MRGSFSHPGIEYVVLGVTLTLAAVMWRRAITGLPAQRRGNIVAAILVLLAPPIIVADLLIPY